MTKKWNVSGSPRRAATGQTWATQAGYLGDGIDTAATHYSSATDPSTGAPVAWGVAEVGSWWHDTGVDGTAATPVMKQWQQLTATPTYGWRTIKLRKIKFLPDPTLAAVTFTSVSPAAADVAWEDVALATTLDGATPGDVQDAGQLACKVSEVLLLVTITPGASETITNAAKGYIQFRQKGATNQDVRVYAQVSGRPTQAQVWVPLDTNEKMQFGVVVGTGTPSFAYTAYILAIAEQI